jgi:hypothetical protein
MGAAGYCLGQVAREGRAKASLTQQKCDIGYEMANLLRFLREGSRVLEAPFYRLEFTLTLHPAFADYPVPLSGEPTSRRISEGGRNAPRVQCSTRRRAGVNLAQTGGLGATGSTEFCNVRV